MKKTKRSPTLSEGEKLMGWVYLALEILVLPSAIALLGQNFGGFSPAVANFLYYAANALCCGLIFRNLLAQSLSRAGEQFGQLLWVCLTGFLCLLGANQITEALSALLISDFVNANNTAVSAMVMTNPFLMSLGLIVLVPLGEECLFRGLLFGGFFERNRWGAYICSVVCFALAHVIGYLGTQPPLPLLVCLIQYVPPGIILAYSFEKTGSLFAPMLIHAAVNAGSILSLR